MLHVMCLQPSPSLITLNSFMTSLLLPLIQSVRRTSASCHITLRVRHILARFNACADHLSHGRIADARCLASEEFGVDLVMVR